MADTLPVRKYIKVWVKKRKNNARNTGKPTISYTLEWVEFGQRRFMSLGTGATAAYSRQAAADKERELNTIDQGEGLDPITWEDFQKKYLETIYPGYDLPSAERKTKMATWGKSVKSMLRERLAINSFTRIVAPTWCHEITADVRERFISKRLGEVGSAESVDCELRVYRLLFNVLEDWKHRRAHSNPFAGRGRATVGSRRKRAKAMSNLTKVEHFTRPQITAMLKQADKEVNDEPDNWQRHRLRALVYTAAYTGARIGEIVHFEWEEIDWDMGVAWVRFKIEHDLKTESSQAPVGLPDALLPVLKDWKQYKTCKWLFPNSDGTPWTTGGPGRKHLDQFKALAKRAGVEPATWKMFRHSLSTHGKTWFGLSKEQMKVQLRHSNIETQNHYDHADLLNLRASVKGIDFRA
jgi:integrase